MTSLFKSINHKVNSALGKEPTEEEAIEEEKQILRHEKRRRAILKKLRNKYIEKKLFGSISISSSLFNTEHSVSCDINDDDYNDSSSVDSSRNEDNEIDSEAVELNKQQKEEEETFVKLSILYGERLISKLQKRAKSYRTLSYRDNMSLSSSTSITGPLGFYSIGLCCSATVKSLLKDA